jgi:hypothetical protein
MPLCKKLDCDAKSEPPYLATTLLRLKSLDSHGCHSSRNLASPPWTKILQLIYTITKVV